MTVEEALDLYPEVLDHQAGKTRDFTRLLGAARVASETQRLDPNTGLPVFYVYTEVFQTLAAAYWQLKRGGEA